MTVAELMEKLEDYGGHLDVMIVGPDEKYRPVSEVTDSSTPDGVVVELVWDS